MLPHKGGYLKLNLVKLLWQFLIYGLSLPSPSGKYCEHLTMFKTDTGADTCAGRRNSFCFASKARKGNEEHYSENVTTSLTSVPCPLAKFLVHDVIYARCKSVK